MESNSLIVNEFIDLIDKTENFLRSYQNIYGDHIFFDYNANVSELASSDNKRKLLVELYYQTSRCQNCKLGRTRRRVVFGSGDINSNIMLIGEAPGYHEDLQGKPFVGEAGQLLDRILTAINLKREKVFITNIVKCRPPGNRDPEPEEQRACRSILDQQINIIQPQYILILGRIAAHALLNTTKTIKELRGKIYNLYGAKAVVTYHPAALLRNQSLKRDTWVDVQLFQKCFQEKV